MSEGEEYRSYTDLYVRHRRELGEKELREILQPYKYEDLLYRDTYAIIKVKSNVIADEIIKNIKDQPPHNLHIERSKIKKEQIEINGKKQTSHNTNNARFKKRNVRQHKQSHTELENNEVSSVDSTSVCELIFDVPEDLLPQAMAAYTIQNCKFTLKDFVVRLSEFWMTSNYKLNKFDNYQEGIVEKLIEIFDEFSIDMQQSEVKPLPQYLANNQNHGGKNILDFVEAGDELECNIIKFHLLGQVCYLAIGHCPRMKKQYRSLFQQFAEACEKEESSPLVPDRVMAVKLKTNQNWYRSIYTPNKGLALVDIGNIVPSDDVDRSVICPKDYLIVPEICTLLTDVKNLKPNIGYFVKILDKDSCNRKTRVEVSDPNDPAFIRCLGFMVPYLES